MNQFLPLTQAACLSSLLRHLLRVITLRGVWVSTATDSAGNTSEFSALMQVAASLLAGSGEPAEVNLVSGQLSLELHERSRAAAAADHVFAEF